MTQNLITIEKYIASKENAVAIMTIFNQYPSIFYDEDITDIMEALSRTSDATYQKYIARDTDKICGFICFSHPSDSAYIWCIDWFAVDIQYQNQGIGTRLLQFVEEIVQKSSTPRIFLDTAHCDNPITVKTCAFYEKCGYKQVGEIPHYYRDQENKRFYYKDLAAE